MAPSGDEARLAGIDAVGLSGDVVPLFLVGGRRPAM